MTDVSAAQLAGPTEIVALVEGISPLDALEAEHRARALAWLAGTTDVCRRAKPATPDPHLVSYFVVVNRALTRTLLVEHRLAGLWLPPGGHVEPGEHPRQTVLREAREELGIDAELAGGPEAGPRFITWAETVGPDSHVDVSLWYLVVADVESCFDWDAREFAGVRWWSREELRATDRSGFDPHLMRFLDKVGFGEDMPGQSRPPGAEPALEGSPEAESWEAEYARGRYLTEPPVDFVADIVTAASDAGLTGAPGLYIGCGNGRNLVPLVREGLDLVGLDISATAIAQLRRRLPGRADRLVVGDLGALPPGRTFSLVVGIQVFQHGQRDAAHDHIRAAQARTAVGGLFCLRVNAVGTDVWPAHDLVETSADGGFTIRYTAGSKEGLDVHFFSAAEIEALFAGGFEPVLPMRLQATERRAPDPGQWSQWEGIWRRVR